MRWVFGCLLALVVDVAWVAALVFPALGVFWFASVLLVLLLVDDCLRCVAGCLTAILMGSLFGWCLLRWLTGLCGRCCRLLGLC